MVTHHLKTWPIYFDAVKRGEKTFEVRKNDRSFQKGDIVELACFDPVIQVYRSEPKLRFRVGWLLQGGQFGIEPGFCVFSLEPIAAALTEKDTDNDR